MSEKILADFENSFRTYKEKRILLYGTGQNAKAIVERYDDTYRLIGILTFSRVGSILYGKHTFGMEDIEGLAPDLIVIADQDASCEKLLSCPGNIPVYDLSGKRWNGSANDDLSAYDVVSFSVEALLRREMPEGEAFFQQVKKEALAKGLNCPADFPQKRVLAARKQHYLALNTIYDLIQAETGLSEKEKEALLETELQMTSVVIKADPKLNELYRNALNIHKTIVMVSDSHFDAKQLAALLKTQDIVSFDRIFSSCEYQKYKKTGLLAEVRKAYPNKKIIHLGSDQESDGISARKCGLSAWVIF